MCNAWPWWARGDDFLLWTPYPPRPARAVPTFAPWTGPPPGGPAPVLWTGPAGSWRFASHGPARPAPGLRLCPACACAGRGASRPMDRPGLRRACACGVRTAGKPWPVGVRVGGLLSLVFSRVGLGAKPRPLALRAKPSRRSVSGLRPRSGASARSACPARFACLLWSGFARLSCPPRPLSAVVSRWSVRPLSVPRRPSASQSRAPGPSAPPAPLRWGGLPSGPGRAFGSLCAPGRPRVFRSRAAGAAWRARCACGRHFACPQRSPGRAAGRWKRRAAPPALSCSASAPPRPRFALPFRAVPSAPRASFLQLG
jgi:hypothetical protein